MNEENKNTISKWLIAKKIKLRKALIKMAEENGESLSRRKADRLAGRLLGMKREEEFSQQDKNFFAATKGITKNYFQ